MCLPRFFARASIFLKDMIGFALLLACITGFGSKLLAQPVPCDSDGTVSSYVVGYALFDEDDGDITNEVICVVINGHSFPPIVVPGPITDDEARDAVKAGIEALLFNGEPRFPTTPVGDTTLLVMSDRMLGSDITEFTVDTDGNTDLVVMANRLRMPAMVVDFDPKDPMMGVPDLDVTLASSNDANGLQLSGNQGVTGETPFSVIMGVSITNDDWALSTLMQDGLFSDPNEVFCLMSARSGFAIQAYNDSPVFQGEVCLSDLSMGATALVPPVVTGIKPNIIDPAAALGTTITISGFNMRDPDNFNGEVPVVKINDGAGNPVTMTVAGAPATDRHVLVVTFPLDPLYSDGDIPEIRIEASWGIQIINDRLAYKTGASFINRQSTVNATGPTSEPDSLSYDVLLVNGSPGDALNVVEVTLADPLLIELRIPPSMRLAGTADFIIWAHVGNPPFLPLDLDSEAQGMLGTAGSSILPRMGHPRLNREFTGAAPRLNGMTGARRPIANLVTIGSQLNRSKHVILQGIIRDDSSSDSAPVGKMGVTNAIVIKIAE